MGQKRQSQRGAIMEQPLIENLRLTRDTVETTTTKICSSKQLKQIQASEEYSRGKIDN